MGLDGLDVSATKGGANSEEKRRHIKSLIEKIPTAKNELFSYPLDWATVDSVRRTVTRDLLECSHRHTCLHAIFPVIH